MEIKKQFLGKYMHDIAIDQIAAEYTLKGYKVSKEDLIGKYRADLIAKRGDETIVIEVKSGKMTPEKKETIRQLSNYVRSQGNYKFLVAVATPPKDKKFEIPDIQNLIKEEIINNFPPELDELSSQTKVDDINDIDIDEVKIDHDLILVRGSGVINLQLQFGSNSDQKNGDGYETQDSFPFDFEITLQYDSAKQLEIREIKKIKFDTSSFYE